MPRLLVGMLCVHDVLRRATAVFRMSAKWLRVHRVLCRVLRLLYVLLSTAGMRGLPAEWLPLRRVLWRLLRVPSVL